MYYLTATGDEADATTHFAIKFAEGATPDSSDDVVQEWDVSRENAAPARKEGMLTVDWLNNYK